MAQEERNMDKKKDTLEQRLAGDFKKLAEEEEQNIEKCESEDDSQMPEGSKEAIRAKLDEEIEKIRKAEEEELYSRLSEEDRRALELGRKVIREEEERKTRRRRKPKKLYIAVAALVAALFAFSANAFGVQERMVTAMKSLVGDREIEQVDSSDENLVIVEEDEEEAYQKISDEFGVEPVKITIRPEELLFEKMIYDENNQVVEIWYELDERSVVYFINSSYKESSWGADVEDEILKTEIKEINGCEVEIKKYNVSKTGHYKFSAQFVYKGLEYLLVGEMTQQDFEKIVENLHFY